ncbi:MAG: hypothetical protein LBS46_00045 [Dysgonamonadaceae bacterium]|jgi:hypothetical protein|nr:hypothetical protein [Dysgonamonadaceae bacterium]
MKYYNLKIERRFPKEDKVLGHANGEFVPNGKAYFDRMGKGEIIEDAPLFDYFYLKSYGSKEDWEWRLQDIHGFIGVGSIITGYYISDDFKVLLENFKIAPKYHFYETRLLYKGKKLKYWIFQFPINPLKNINFKESEFVLPNEDKIFDFHSDEEYLFFYRKEYRETKRELRGVKECLNDHFDIAKTTNNDIVVSEQLKNAIEEAMLQGFIFSELDYKVIANE